MAERQLGRMCKRRGCGQPAKAQATARGRALTHEEIAHVKTRRAAPAAPSTPAAALVEEESTSTAKRRKVSVVLRQWSIPRCMAECRDGSFFWLAERAERFTFRFFESG